MDYEKGQDFTWIEYSFYCWSIQKLFYRFETNYKIWISEGLSNKIEIQTNKFVQIDLIIIFNVTFDTFTYSKLKEEGIKGD